MRLANGQFEIDGDGAVPGFRFGERGRGRQHLFLLPENILLRVLTFTGAGHEAAEAGEFQVQALLQFYPGAGLDDTLQHGSQRHGNGGGFEHTYPKTAAGALGLQDIDQQADANGGKQQDDQRRRIPLVQFLRQDHNGLRTANGTKGQGDDQHDFFLGVEGGFAITSGPVGTKQPGGMGMRGLDDGRLTGFLSTDNYRDHETKTNGGKYQTKRAQPEAIVQIPGN